MLTQLTLSLFAITPSIYEPVVETVDLIEVNHFYDEAGRLLFDQTIFYNWCYRTNRPQVIAWRLIKHPNQLPIRNWPHPSYVSTWHDGDILRRVVALSLTETWTQYDPELVEREALPKEQRTELYPPYPRLHLPPPAP